MSKWYIKQRRTKKKLFKKTFLKKLKKVLTFQFQFGILIKQLEKNKKRNDL